MDKPKREAILDLSKYVNEKIRVKFSGGREGECPGLLRGRADQRDTHCGVSTVTGVLKGFDQLLNLVLDDVVENVQTGESRDSHVSGRATDGHRRVRGDNEDTGLGRVPRADNHPPQPRRRLRGDRQPLRRARVVTASRALRILDYLAISQRHVS